MELGYKYVTQKNSVSGWILTLNDVGLVADVTAAGLSISLAKFVMVAKQCNGIEAFNDAQALFFYFKTEQDAINTVIMLKMIGRE